MNTYKVYFEIFTKKMVTTVEASSEEKAKSKIKDRIKFYKVQKTNDPTYDKKAFDDIFKASNVLFDKVNKFFKTVKW
jgi:hypothetical protein